MLDKEIGIKYKTQKGILDEMKKVIR